MFVLVTQKKNFFSWPDPKDSRLKWLYINLKSVQNKNKLSIPNTLTVCFWIKIKIIRLWLFVMSTCRLLLLLARHVVRSSLFTHLLVQDLPNCAHKILRFIECSRTNENSWNSWTIVNEEKITLNQSAKVNVLKIHEKHLEYWTRNTLVSRFIPRTCYDLYEVTDQQSGLSVHGHEFGHGLSFRHTSVRLRTRTETWSFHIRRCNNKKLSTGTKSDIHFRPSLTHQKFTF